MTAGARALWIVASGLVCAPGNGASAAPAALLAEQPQSLAPGQGHRMYFGDGHGGFADSGQILTHTSAFARRPAAGDIDGDGDIDVVVSRTVWLNNGRGEFASQNDRIESAEPETGVQLADLDGDGDLDLFAIHGSNTIRIHLNDGNGRFRERGGPSGFGASAGSTSIGGVALGDVDGDGSIDAVTVGWRGSVSDICPNRVWLNDGHGGFHDSGQILDEADRYVHGVAIADLDGDNLPDIALALITPGEAGKVYFNTGKGGFRESGQKLGHQWAHGVAPGDLDDDGDLDLFFVCGDPRNGTPNEVWLNDGHGQFTDSGLRLGNAYSRGAALGDLDGDSDLDAFVANLRLADASKVPWVFGGAAPEVWLNTTRRADGAAASRDAQAGALVLRSTCVLGGSDADDLGWLRKPRSGGDGRLYFAGTTRSPDFPVAPGSGSPPYQGGNDWGTEDVFLACYDPGTRAIDAFRLLGGARGPEFVADLQIDPRGSIHLVGNTGSVDFPTTTHAAQTTFAGPVFRHADGFVTVIAPSGGGIEYSSFFGAGGNDWLLQLFLDPDGSATVFGITESPNLLPPELTLHDGVLTAAPTLFVARLDGRTHQIVRARLLANGWDAAVERLESGAFVIAGTTPHPAFAATDGAYDRSYNGGTAQAGGDLFLLRLSGDLMRVEFATLFGGGGDEFSPQLAILPSGEIVLGGRTTSADLPVTTGKRDGPQSEGKRLFLARFTEDGSRVVFCDMLTDAHPSHRLGAMAHDGGRRLAFVGTTASEALPFAPPLRQSRLAGDSDAFVLVFDTSENAVVQCTPIGGSGSDTADALAFGRDGRLFVLGTTDSEDFPGRAALSRRGQGSDVYVAEFATDERVSEWQPESEACDGAATVAAIRPAKRPPAMNSP